MELELFHGMLQKDRDEFRRVCNKLLSVCFIVRRSEKTKADYYFILKWRPVFEEYIGVLGFTLEINEDIGVIQLVNRENYNHLRLRLNESVILLILRVLYDEKRRELLDTSDVIINIGDIQERYLALKIREKQIDKGVMNNALHLFQRYNLIELLDKNSLEEDARVLIYDSILMAIRADDIRRVSEMLDIYRRRKGDGDEETDERAAD